MSLSVLLVVFRFTNYLQALHYSDFHRRTKPDLATILDATRGIIFLGTPHRGSEVTTLPKLVASIIQAVQDVNMELIRDVETNSHTLDRIADSFGQIMDRRTFTVFSFEEELAMRGGRKVCIGSMAMTMGVC
jgi:protein SERAC1